jgi:hypothetical protein
MLTFLTFLRDYEMVFYYILGLVALWYLYRFLVAQFHLMKTTFGLERELFSGQRNGAIGRLFLILLAVSGIFLGVNYGLPEAERAERLKVEAGAVDLPTVTPTPTRFELFGVDVSGCSNPKATILQPKPGDAVTGTIDILIVADIPDFAYFLLELGTPDVPDVWKTLFGENLIDTPAAPDGTPVPDAHIPATEEEPFVWSWNSSNVPPGVYHLRLTVFAMDQEYPAPCVVPIQVLAPPIV